MTKAEEISTLLSTKILLDFHQQSTWDFPSDPEMSLIPLRFLWFITVRAATALQTFNQQTSSILGRLQNWSERNTSTSRDFMLRAQCAQFEREITSQTRWWFVLPVLQYVVCSKLLFPKRLPWFCVDFCRRLSACLKTFRLSEKNTKCLHKHLGTAVTMETSITIVAKRPCEGRILRDAQRNTDQEQLNPCFRHHTKLNRHEIREMSSLQITLVTHSFTWSFSNKQLPREN